MLTGRGTTAAGRTLTESSAKAVAAKQVKTIVDAAQQSENRLDMVRFLS
jgi:hypothetical protein